MKKVFVLLALLALLLLTGCTTDCTLIMDQSKITSNCTISVTHDELFDENVSEGTTNPKLHEFLSDTIILAYRKGEDKKYAYRSERETLSGNRYTGSYVYDYNTINYSTLFDCIEKKVYRYNGKEVYLELSGKNTCSQNSLLRLSVKIPFKVRKTNAHQINGDYYNWEFKSKEDIDILIDIGEDAVTKYNEDIEHEEQLHKSISIGLIVGIIILITLVVLILIQKRKKKNAI